MIHDHDGIVAIDTFMHGREGITAAYLLPGETPALIEVGPGSSFEATMEGLSEAGSPRLEVMIVTHIHLDHAGAIGHFAKEFPDAKIVVRAEGAPHLVDPSRLWASASRIYDDMEKLWGELIPVPEDRIQPVSDDGPIFDLGGGRVLSAIYSPGHASHHMAIFDPSHGDMFCGDAIGVYSPDAKMIRPATPPPEFDPDMAIASIEKLAGMSPERLFPTHFGPTPDPAAAFTEGAERIRQWVAAVTEVFTPDVDVSFVAEALRARREEFYPGMTDEVVEKLENTTSYELNAAGILRYLKKRAERSD